MDLVPSSFGLDGGTTSIRNGWSTPRRQSNTASTYNTTGSMPLAFKLDEFFVLTIFLEHFMATAYLLQSTNLMHQLQLIFISLFLDVNECNTSPFENNGTCLDELDGYTCQCTDQWFGDNCAGIYCSNIKYLLLSMIVKLEDYKYHYLNQ